MLERYWAWNYEIKDLAFWPGDEYKGHNKPVEVVKAADAQATIADLQGRLEAAQNKQTALEKSVRNLTEFYDKYNGTPCEQIRHQQEVEQLQQRVAQLEGDVEEQKRNYLSACETIYKMYVAATGREGVAPKRGVVEDLADLQADHARVLWLVQALPLAGGIVSVDEEPTGWIVSYGDDDSQENFAFGLEQKEAEAIRDLLAYRQSLPAQPAPGHEAIKQQVCTEWAEALQKMADDDENAEGEART